MGEITIMKDIGGLCSSKSFDIACRFGYACWRPGRPGAAEPSKPRQGRETATVRKCLWVPPVTCPDIFLMKSKRSHWVFIVLALLAGAGMGLAYGWYIDPVDFFDLTPDTLSPDYKADYVLMIAEAYRAEQDPGQAARRLAVFGSQSPSAIAASGLEYARAYGYVDSDVALLQELVTAMQAWSGILP
jgi:hypothetical protein